MGGGKGREDGPPTAAEVREQRERLGLSQTAFAELLGLSGRAATISEWERGAAPPSVTRRQVRERVAAVYGDAPETTDRDRYTASVFAMLEGDAEMVRGVAERQLAKIREARRVLLAPAMPRGLDALETAARAATDAAASTPAAPVRGSRRKAGGRP